MDGTADHYDPVPALAALIWSAVYEDRSATRLAEALLPRLGIGGNDPVSTDAIEAGLRRAIGLALDLSDLDALHALTTALQDYAEKERDIADRMRAQAEAAG
jgi:hypothetical protein